MNNISLSSDQIEKNNIFYRKLLHLTPNSKVVSRIDVTKSNGIKSEIVLFANSETWHITMFRGDVIKIVTTD